MSTCRGVVTDLFSVTRLVKWSAYIAARRSAIAEESDASGAKTASTFRNASQSLEERTWSSPSIIFDSCASTLNSGREFCERRRIYNSQFSSCWWMNINLNSFPLVVFQIFVAKSLALCILTRAHCTYRYFVCTQRSQHAILGLPSCSHELRRHNHRNAFPSPKIELQRQSACNGQQAKCKE